MNLIETKAPGKTPRPEQLRDHKRRAELGVEVIILDTKEKIDDYTYNRLQESVGVGCYRTRPAPRAE